MFTLCFFGVHIAKIAMRGWRVYDETAASKTDEKSPDNSPEKTPVKSAEQKTDSAQNTPEPVYYIVEKKRRRSKASYGEPKEIRFK